MSVVNGDAPPVKKKHKGGNYEVSQGISSQRKVHEDVNGKLVEKGLEGKAEYRKCYHIRTTKSQKQVYLTRALASFSKI